MGTRTRTPAQASTVLTRNIDYHLLQTLPKDYGCDTIVNRKRRKTPEINDAPVSSSDEDSNSVNDIKINNNADDSSSSGWKQPLEYATTRQERSNNGTSGKASTTFRDPPSKTDGSAQRKSTRGQRPTSSPKRSREVIESGDNDNILDEFGQMRSSQGQGQSRAKKMKVYRPTAVNIHGSGSSAGRAQSSVKGLSAGAKSRSGATDGFRIPDLEAMEEKCKYRQRALCLGIMLIPVSEQR